MNNINDEEALGLLNRLLEQLHQAGYTNHGSKIEVVYVASGAQYVNHIDTQIFGEHKQQEETPPKSVKDTRPTPVNNTPPPRHKGVRYFCVLSDIVVMRGQDNL